MQSFLPHASEHGTRTLSIRVLSGKEETFMVVAYQVYPSHVIQITDRSKLQYNLSMTMQTAKSYELEHAEATHAIGRPPYLCPVYMLKDMVPALSSNIISMLPLVVRIWS